MLNLVLFNSFGSWYYLNMNTIRALINNEVEELEKNFSNLFEINTTLHKDIEIFIQGPSKRIRSIVCLLYLKSNNVVISDKIYKLLVAGELIHNASLLHDDVIDDSEIRRGNEAFFKKYNYKASILSGDYLLSIAVKNLIKIGNEEILRNFLSATQEMSNAELKQFLNRNKEIDINEYIDIINGKTASLFQAMLISSSILSGIKQNKEKTLGKLIGLLFQINNDFQTDSIINDKQNGIRTIIDILGIEKTQSLKDNYKKEAREIINSLPNKNYSKGLEDLVKILWLIKKNLKQD